MRTQVRFLASLTGLRIWRCHELWCMSQTWLGSRVAVALAYAGGYSSVSTPYAAGVSLKDQKKKKSGYHLKSCHGPPTCGGFWESLPHWLWHPVMETEREMSVTAPRACIFHEKDHIPRKARPNARPHSCWRQPHPSNACSTT